MYAMMRIVVALVLVVIVTLPVWGYNDDDKIPFGKESDRFQYQQQQQRPEVEESPFMIIRDDYPWWDNNDDDNDLDEECVDLRDHCRSYAQQNGCTIDPLYMLHHCPVSCRTCKSDDEYQQQRRRVVPLSETFGLREFHPLVAVSGKNHRSNNNNDEAAVLLPLNGMWIHSILSDGRNVQDQIPPQRVTLRTTASRLDDTPSLVVPAKIHRVNRYLKEVVDVQPHYQLVRDKCRTVVAHTDCAIWSIPAASWYNDRERQEMDNNDDDEDGTSREADDTTNNTTTTTTNRCRDDWDFMKSHGCYAFCYKCEYLHLQSVCPVNRNEKNALYPGDLDALFTNIVHNFHETYNITVLSRPYTEEDEDDDSDEQQPVDGPWILQLDNFLTAPEAETMIALGTEIGYEASHTVGALDDFGKNEDTIDTYRTSRNAWCETDACIDHEVTQRLLERITNLTNIHADRYEQIQLLQYTPGQYYRTHSDHIEYQIDRQQGVRVLTVFAYLNTLPQVDDDDDTSRSTNDDDVPRFTDDEHGHNGGTNFPHLNLTVLPKLGRVIIWPSVLNDDPHQLDERTDHQALVVTHGTKYGANVWIHQRDYTCPEED